MHRLSWVVAVALASCGGGGGASLETFAQDYAIAFCDAAEEASACVDDIPACGVPASRDECLISVEAAILGCMDEGEFASVSDRADLCLRAWGTLECSSYEDQRPYGLGCVDVGPDSTDTLRNACDAFSDFCAASFPSKFNQL